MSTSPNDAQDEGVDKQSVDELADANHAPDDAEAGKHFLFRSANVFHDARPHFAPIERVRYTHTNDENCSHYLYLGTSSAPPVKRGRGRPKGSKNKKSGASSSAAESPTTPAVPRKRGRPPKVRTFLSCTAQHHVDLLFALAGEERRYWRGTTPEASKRETPKNPKPPAGETAASGEPSEKKKRGRPKKTT
ncbi:hypothetical protein CPB84DRAFT_889529 [Gymnopilus junonius]|uniref:Uncharacterized protein n=1 Tax=Gymnopilus junonius TaxID=109634 RepID=A0A9P5TP21_GYMJU|nr:hypothetical protein CPB84DRAFT_889529 [Gymnopilus junonius]